MPTLSLTDKYLASIAGSGDRQQFYDAKIRGLVLRVGPSGEPKSWSVVYRKDGGKQRVTLGSYPAVTLAKAREGAQAILGEVAKGGDPAGNKRAEATKAMTVGDLIAQYIERRASEVRSAPAIEWRLNKYVLPEIGRTKLPELHRRDVALFLDRMKAPTRVKGKARRGTPEMANRVYDDLKAMSAWAVRAGYLDADPLAPLERPAEKKSRDRVLSAEEMRAILSALPTSKTTAALKAMIRLLWLTACRASEISGLRVAEVDLERRTINLPGERTKNSRAHVVPLSPDAVEVLREAMAAAGSGAEFVFPSPTADGPIEGHAISVAVRRNLDHFQAGQWTPHDIRRTVATNLGELGVSPHVVEVVLNHVSGFQRTTAGRIYNLSKYAREHREALELWATRLEAIREGVDNIAALEPKRA